MHITMHMARQLQFVGMQAGAQNLGNSTLLVLRRSRTTFVTALSAATVPCTSFAAFLDVLSDGGYMVLVPLHHLQRRNHES